MFQIVLVKRPAHVNSLQTHNVLKRRHCHVHSVMTECKTDAQRVGVIAPESHIQDSGGSEPMELSSGLIHKGAGSIAFVSSLFLREWYQEENPIFKRRPSLTK